MSLFQDYLKQREPASLRKSMPTYSCAFCHGSHQLIPVCHDCMGGLATPMGAHPLGIPGGDIAPEPLHTGEPKGHNTTPNQPRSGAPQAGSVANGEPTGEPATRMGTDGPTSGHHGEYPDGGELPTHTAANIGPRSARMPR